MLLNKKKALLLLAVSLTMFACGQKNALYQPPPAAENQPASENKEQE